MDHMIFKPNIYVPLYLTTERRNKFVTIISVRKDWMIDKLFIFIQNSRLLNNWNSFDINQLITVEQDQRWT